MYYNSQARRLERRTEKKERHSEREARRRPPLSLYHPPHQREDNGHPPHQREAPVDNGRPPQPADNGSPPSQEQPSHPNQRELPVDNGSPPQQRKTSVDSAPRRRMPVNEGHHTHQRDDSPPHERDTPVGKSHHRELQRTPCERDTPVNGHHTHQRDGSSPQRERPLDDTNLPHQPRRRVPMVDTTKLYCPPHQRNKKIPVGNGANGASSHQNDGRKFQLEVEVQQNQWWRGVIQVRVAHSKGGHQIGLERMACTYP